MTAPLNDSAPAFAPPSPGYAPMPARTERIQWMGQPRSGSFAAVSDDNGMLGLYLREHPSLPAHSPESMIAQREYLIRRFPSLSDHPNLLVYKDRRPGYELGRAPGLSQLVRDAAHGNLTSLYVASAGVIYPGECTVIRTFLNASGVTLMLGDLPMPATLHMDMSHFG